MVAHLDSRDIIRQGISCKADRFFTGQLLPIFKFNGYLDCMITVGPHTKHDIAMFV